MKRIKLKKLKKKKINTKLSIILFIIVIGLVLSYMLINYISKKINPFYMSYAETEVNKILTEIINNSVTEEVEKEMNINEIFNIQKNESGDIQLIEYNSINVSKILGKITNNIQNNLTKIEKGNIDLTDNKLLNINKNKLKRGIIYEIPIGVYSNSIFLSNLGPKIPVKMQLIGDVISSISTNVKEYGINNALIEVGVTIELNSRVFLPYISNDIKIKGTIPIALKLIQGKIPSYYLNGFKSDSNIITSSIIPQNN
ncbi:MAG: sporulation protein YunB [Tenericutes bacterium]|nr:sporulation protein YunB [Mycoplasmatota bacterium]